MTANEMRIALAEWAGWHNIVFRGIAEPRESDYIGRHVDISMPGTTGIHAFRIPDWPKDLNAVHEIFASMDDSDKIGCLGFLHEGCRGKHIDKDVALALATANDWCVAILRQIGKWK
jgi:hypothetical protein